MLEQFAEEIWITDGPTLSVAGFAYPTRSIVIRLTDGELFVWSPTALPDALKTAVDRLGPVRHIVAPNALHHRFVGDWHRAYPGARLHPAPGLRAKRPDLPWADDLADRPAAAWLGEIDQVVVRGNRITTEVVFFHHRSRTTIVTDLIQHFPPGWFTGWRAVVARLDLLTATRPTVPRKFRVAFTDREAAREALRRIMAWPTDMLLAAHAEPVTADGRAAITRAFRWLLD